MVYSKVREGIFRSRPNRFVAEVELDGASELFASKKTSPSGNPDLSFGLTVEKCHVKNTGRCKELLVDGAKVYVSKADNPNRSTKYDLIAVHKGGLLINMDSQAPNTAFGEYLRNGKFLEIGRVSQVKAEAKYGASRFDFYAETDKTKAFIEVKGVTLEENGIAMFPDAPTERGIKHLNELAACIKDGFRAYVVFVMQMEGISRFTPNYKTHAAFGVTLAKVMGLGVKAFAFDCKVTPESMEINRQVQIVL